MALNFPADPTAGQQYEGPNGVNYLWNESLQSWVVESIDYDSDYVNISGDTMTGSLNFATASSPIGLNWGGNPKLVFMTGGETELRGRYTVRGKLTISSSEGINFTNDPSIITYNNSRRLVFTSNHTHISYGGSMYLSVTDKGVQYHGHFTQSKNVTTVEYVANEIDSIQTQIDLLNYDLADNITDVINDKAVLLEGNQDIDGTKKFKKQILVDRGEDVGSNAVNSFIIKGRIGSNHEYQTLLKDYRRPMTSTTNDSVMYYGAISSNNDLVNKKYVEDNFLQDVTGTAGYTDDTGVRTTRDGGTKKIYMEKATISQYGVERRGQLPLGNNAPNNSQLEIGQMYYVKSTKRVLIRVT